MGDVTKGFLEASVTRSKTSTTLERKTRLLPMVADISCLKSEPWRVTWFDLLKKAGPELGPDKALLPLPTTVGTCHRTPMTADRAARWLRALLYKYPGMAASEVKVLGTHSLKSTGLSWAAKYGMSLQTRAILGYHSKSKGSVLVYGRDNV